MPIHKRGPLRCVLALHAVEKDGLFKYQISERETGLVTLESDYDYPDSKSALRAGREFAEDTGDANKQA